MGPYDYPDRGFGAIPAADVHHATLVILAASTADVMSVKNMMARVSQLGRGRGFMTTNELLVTARAYRWFTEGFDTADLKDAKALL